MRRPIPTIYDQARKRTYVAGGEGFLEAFDQQGPDQYTSIGKVATASGARPGGAHRGAQQAEIRVYGIGN